MERLTWEETRYWSDNGKEELIQRLAEYEDTGLMPEEIRTLKETKKGRWKKDEFGWAQCPLCEEFYAAFDVDMVKSPEERAEVWKAWDRLYKFCPNCGAHLGA